MADWPEQFEDPPGPGTPPENAEMPQRAREEQPPTTHVERVLREHGPALLAIDGVEGIGTGLAPTGAEAIVLYLRDAQVAASLPDEIDGVPVQKIVTGPIEAQ